MSTHSKCHTELNEHGIGKCGVPMWWGWGGDAGFCDKEAYGEQTPSKVWHLRNPEYPYSGDTIPTREVDGQRVRKGYLCCPAHGGPKVRHFMDGDKWCCVRPDFVNLQESHAGFGATREESAIALEANIREMEGGAG